MEWGGDGVQWRVGNERRGKQTNLYESAHDKTYKMACAPSKDSEQSEHLSSLIRVFRLHEESFSLAAHVAPSED